jgi:hypothetical protein
MHFVLMISVGLGVELPGLCCLAFKLRAESCSSDVSCNRPQNIVADGRADSPLALVTFLSSRTTLSYVKGGVWR